MNFRRQTENKRARTALGALNVFGVGAGLQSVAVSGLVRGF